MTGLRVLLFAFTLVGCSVTEVPPAPSSIAVNECEGDGDCNGAQCQRGACVETRGTVTTLLVEVTPPATAQGLAGLSFYHRLTGLDRAGGDRDIAISPVAMVTGAITATVEPGCVFEGPPPDRPDYVTTAGTIPVGLSFTPSERVLGVAAATYVASSPRSDWREGSPYDFRIKLPLGDYDMYIEPRLPAPGSVEQESCKVPPSLLRRKAISANLTLDVQLPEPSALALTIQLPAGDHSLDGWSVDLLDSLSARPLSTHEVLSNPTANLGEGVTEYQTTLLFAPAYLVDEDGNISADPELLGHEIIRLSPPEGVTAPSLLFQRDVLDFALPAGVALIDMTPPERNASLTTAFPANVRIEGQAARADNGAPVEAAVRLVATVIEGTDNQASFTRTVQVGPTGLFSLDVPPGTYRVRAVPNPQSGLAAAETEWQAALSTTVPGVQGGKLIELPVAPIFGGTASVAGTGGAAFGALVSATVSPLSVQTNVLALALGTSPLLPSASAAIVARDGSFALSADPGTYGFFVQPEARSRYAWFVQPSLVMPADGGEEALRRMHPRLPLPVIYRGNVVIDGSATRVPGALIRAYAYITDQGTYTSNPAASAAVIPVAEARADENGAFELLIPASLN